MLICIERMLTYIMSTVQAPPQGPPPAYQPRQVTPQPRREAWQTSESQNVSNQQRTNQQNYAGQPVG